MGIWIALLILTVTLVAGAATGRYLFGGSGAGAAGHRGRPKPIEQAAQAARKVQHAVSSQGKHRAPATARVPVRRMAIWDEAPGR
jgi:flagellar basal body-associated protein FliL